MGEVGGFRIIGSSWFLYWLVEGGEREVDWFFVGFFGGCVFIVECRWVDSWFGVVG